jgi:hypothetical protein
MLNPHTLYVTEQENDDDMKLWRETTDRTSSIVHYEAKYPRCFHVKNLKSSINE